MRGEDYLSFVIATKDRPKEIRRMLQSIEAQSYLPQQVVIVDAGKEELAGLKEEFPDLCIKYLRCSLASATIQRNMGIEAADQEATLIGFIDDDVVLESGSLKAMMGFWKEAAEDVAGASFNMANHPGSYLSLLKSIPLVDALGLYSREKGVVSPSGFQTMVGCIAENIYTEWIATGAVVWRRKIFENFRFDEWFGYNYLEDVDFGYRVGKKYRLAVVADAKFYHYPEYEKRGNDYKFGRIEVFNRIYFVKKHRELSLSRCYLALIIRMFMTLGIAIQERRLHHFRRFCGNVTGLAASIFMK